MARDKPSDDIYLNMKQRFDEPDDYAQGTKDVESLNEIRGNRRQTAQQLGFGGSTAGHLGLRYAGGATKSSKSTQCTERDHILLAPHTK